VVNAFAPMGTTASRSARSTPTAAPLNCSPFARRFSAPAARFSSGRTPRHPRRRSPSTTPVPRPRPGVTARLARSPVSEGSGHCDHKPVDSGRGYRGGAYAAVRLAKHPRPDVEGVHVSREHHPVHFYWVTRHRLPYSWCAHCAHHEILRGETRTELRVHRDLRVLWVPLGLPPPQRTGLMSAHDDLPLADAWPSCREDSKQESAKEAGAGHWRLLTTQTVRPCSRESPATKKVNLSTVTERLT
jgi:hypothetical protein